MVATASLLNKTIFGEKRNVYAVLDGASVPGLPADLLRHQLEHLCLFRGELESGVAEVAPYLVALKADAPFTEQILTQGWGKHWGIFACSQADFRTMRKHFRTFLIVHGPKNNPTYFRYYDPRVLRLYLPTCTALELNLVFGPVASYYLEDESAGHLLHLQKSADALVQKRIPVS